VQDVVFVVALIALVGVTVGFALGCRADGVDGTGLRRWRQFGCCPDSDKKLLCAVSSGH
jgi:hypothetical protein